MNSKYLKFYNDKELCDSVYDYIFSFCNRVKFRSSLDNCCNNDYAIKVDTKIYSYEIERIFDSEWGMQGNYITFELTDFVKNVLKQCDLEGLFFVVENENIICFDNITLLKNDEIIFSCCTHEGYINFNKTIERKIAAFCSKKIKDTKTYKKMKQVYQNLRKRYTKKEITLIHNKLFYLNCYVDKACGAFVRQASEYDDITWEEYLDLAKQVFSKEIYIELEKTSSFEQLFENEKNKVQIRNINFQFTMSQLYHLIRRELAFLYLFLDASSYLKRKNSPKIHLDK